MQEHHEAAHLAALGREWIAAWNSRDLERVLALYDENSEMTSDRIQALGFDFQRNINRQGQASDVLGKSADALAQPALRTD